MVSFIVYQHALFTPKLECAVLKMSGHAKVGPSKSEFYDAETWRPLHFFVPSSAPTEKYGNMRTGPKYFFGFSLFPKLRFTTKGSKVTKILLSTPGSEPFW